MKTFLATALGIITCFAIIHGMEFLSMKLFPPAVKIDPKDLEALKNLMSNIPLPALLMIIGGHGLATFFGIFVVNKMDPKSMVGFLVILILMLMMTISNFATVPHPAWFMAADVGIILFGALLGWKALKWNLN